MLWFEDNAAVLASVIKGASSEEELDSGMASVHTILAALGTRVWFEWVESQANWSDGASRLLESDTWAPAHNFVLQRTSVPTWPWEAEGPTRAKEARAIACQSEQSWAI